MLPGLRLRQVRERLGLTYRDVERASFELAARRARPEFILHISRLADIENRSVIPGLHKLYSLSAIYHRNPLELFRWYEIPLDEFFVDGSMFPAPQTHLAAPPAALRVPLRFDPSFDPRRTEFLSRMVQQWGQFEGVLTNNNGHAGHRYGYVGLADRRMMPLLRPGSIVLLDPSVRHIDDDWSSEHDRPMYFVEVRDGYRCGWFHRDNGHLVMQPHPLSRCVPESWKTPEDAEVVGRVIGVVMRLNGTVSTPPGEYPAIRGDSNRKAP